MKTILRCDNKSSSTPDVNMATELGSEIFDHFSKWFSLLRAVANLIIKVKDFKRPKRGQSLTQQ